jgi:hypothetical protein
MSNILDIPQIPTTAIELLQNDLHIGFGGDIAKRLQKARWTDETHATKVFPAAVDALMNAFVQAQSVEDHAYVIAQGSDLTKQRLEKDRQRDTLYKEIRKTVDTFATLTIFPDKQEAALKMQPVMQRYKIDPDGGIEAQTVATQQWLQEQQVNYQLELAAKALGIFESINQLKTLNDEIQQLTADRNDERAQKTTAELKNARLQTDQAYREMVLMVNAQAIATSIDPEASTLNYTYTELIKSIQETIKYYRQVSDERRRANKRVTVKSDIVGNHQYATVAGWTWERLAQENPKSLAPDPTPSAPGVEPVVKAERIVSTDKKALAAGGLCVALDGVPVLPTAAVDALKVYELIAIG